MIVHLAYGKTGLDITVPDDAQVIKAQQAPGLPNEAQAIQSALRNPIGSPALGEIVKPR